jgi:hypothetical protein
LAAGYFFENLKGPRSLNVKKIVFSGLRQKMWLIHFYGAHAAIADSGKPIIF